MCDGRWLPSCLQLTRSHDGFGVVAEYFGRGVFNKVSEIPITFRAAIIFIVCVCVCVCSAA